MPMTQIARLQDLAQRVGEQIAVSDWLTITQERVNLFAEATGDHQWIHVDPARAVRESPFGGPIAHGYLTLSLLAKFSQESIKVADARMAVNYGSNKVRFTSPVPVGRAVRARFTLAAYDEIAGGVQLTWNTVIDIEGSDKPACVVENLSRLYV